MKLRPYTDVPERRRKVLKHVFLSRGERWWTLLEGFVAWGRDWNALRASGALQPEGHRVAERVSSAAEVLDRNHEGWLGRAEQAVDQGRAARRVYPAGSPGRAAYVGDHGVVAIVAGDHLVTCFRPGLLRSRDDEAETLRRVDERVRRRAGVRRATRRASLGQDGYAPPVEGHEP